MGKYDTGAIGNPSEAVFGGLIEIQLGVKPRVFVIISLFKLRSRAFNC